MQFHYITILLYYDILWLYSIVCYVNFLSSWNYLGNFGSFGSMWPWLVEANCKGPRHSGHVGSSMEGKDWLLQVSKYVQILWKYLDALMFSWCNHCLLMSDAIHWFMFSPLSKPQLINLLRTFFYEGLKPSKFTEDFFLWRSKTKQHAQSWIESLLLMSAKHHPAAYPHLTPYSQNTFSESHNCAVQLRISCGSWFRDWQASTHWARHAAWP